jgi:hypothetical protein
MRRLLIACFGVAMVLLASTQIFAAGPQMDAAADAASYIDSIQNADGGFPGFGPASSAGSTLDAVFALSAAGVDPKSVTNGGLGPDDYLATHAAAFSASSPGAAAKLVQGVLTMDLDETNFGSINPLAVMQTNYNAGTGAYGTDTFAQSQFILALDAAGLAVPPLAVSYLSSLQLGNGSWEYCCGFGGDTNTTSLVIRALLAGGVAPSDPDIVAGLGFLAANQEADGGFPYLLGFGSEPNSTGFVLQALVAAGEDISAGGPWDKGAGLTPQAFLLGTQNPATGALQYFGTDDAFATYQGLAGLTLAAYPERADVDGDGLLYAADNCPTIANAGQENYDGNFIDQTPPSTQDDLTWVNSDELGDVCDLDADNDGIANAAEAAGCNGSGTLDPLNRDTDGDRVVDGAECALGTNPASAASKPTPAQCAAYLGVSLSDDTDSDGIRDHVEFCGYNSSPALTDTDGDGIGDGCEIGSLNGDALVNVADMGLLAVEILRAVPQASKLSNMDLNKDGVINPADQGILASLFIPC